MGKKSPKYVSMKSGRGGALIDEEVRKLATEIRKDLFESKNMTTNGTIAAIDKWVSAIDALRSPQTEELRSQLISKKKELIRDEAFGALNEHSFVDRVFERPPSLAKLLDSMAKSFSAPKDVRRATLEGSSRPYRKKFERCVKTLRKKLPKESSAIAICTKSVLHSRGRTMKRYKKGRLITQPLRR
jgi:ribosomal protein L29